MFVSFDCEFTRLTDQAELISFGAISETGDTLYRELAPIVCEECSSFVRTKVLPLFNGGEASCERQIFVDVLVRWLERIPAPVLLCDSVWDIYVLTGEIGYRSREARELILPGLRNPVPISLVTDMSGTVQAAVAEGKQQFWLRNTSLRPHHALNDACALMNGWLGAVANLPSASLFTAVGTKSASEQGYK